MDRFVSNVIAPRNLLWEPVISLINVIIMFHFFSDSVISLKSQFVDVLNELCKARSQKRI